MLNHHEIEHASCVYALVNEVTGQQYIGSTINLRQRIASHRSNLRNGVHKSRLLQEAVDQYGLGAFSVVILERVSDLNTLVAQETQYIQQRQPVYNIAPTGGSAKTRVISAERRAAMSAVRKGMPKSPEHRAKVGAALRGRLFSDESRSKMSDAQRRRTPVSEETRAKRSANQRRRWQDPEYRRRALEQLRRTQFVKVGDEADGGADGQKGGAA